MKYNIDIEEYTDRYYKVMDSVALDSYTETSLKATKFIDAIAMAAINVNDSFLMLLTKGYQFTAMPMIRMMVDNCFVVYAASIYKDKDVFFRHFIEGKEVNTLHIGKQALTNRFLMGELDKRFAGVSNLYEESCTYIHPTSYLYHQVIDEFDDGTIINNNINLFTNQGDEEDEFVPTIVDESDEAELEKMMDDICFANEVLITLLEDMADDVRNTKPTSSTYREDELSEFNMVTVMKGRQNRSVKVYLH